MKNKYYLIIITSLFVLIDCDPNNGLIDKCNSTIISFTIPSDTTPNNSNDNIGRVKVTFNIEGLSSTLPASSIRIDPPSSGLQYQYHDFSDFRESYNIDEGNDGYRVLLRRLIDLPAYNNRFEIVIINLIENNPTTGYWNTFDVGLTGPAYWEVRVILLEDYEFNLEGITAHAVDDPNPLLSTKIIRNICL